MASSCFAKVGVGSLRTPDLTSGREDISGVPTELAATGILQVQLGEVRAR